MENENSTSQEQKKFFAVPGRKKKVIIAGIVVLLLLGTIGRWARPRGFALGAMMGYGALSSGSGNVALAAKDFEPVGIVFAEAVVATRDGYRAAYNALMKEAAQKGADAIINVNISSTGGFFKRTWSASALAIKYLDTVPEGALGIQQGISGEIANALLMRGGRWFGR